MLRREEERENDRKIGFLLYLVENLWRVNGDKKMSKLEKEDVWLCFMNYFENIGDNRVIKINIKYMKFIYLIVYLL